MCSANGALQNCGAVHTPIIGETVATALQVNIRLDQLVFFYLSAGSWRTLCWTVALTFFMLEGYYGEVTQGTWSAVLKILPYPISVPIISKTKENILCNGSILRKLASCVAKPCPLVRVCCDL